VATKPSTFLAELKRRKVYRAATAYIVVGVGVPGAAEVILDPLGLEALRPCLVILVLLGFGDRKQALAAVTDRVKRAVAWDAIWSLPLTCGFAAAGDTERALQWLDHTIDYGICNVPYYRDRDPFLVSIRADERFDELMAKAQSRSNSLAAASEDTARM